MTEELDPEAYFAALRDMFHGAPITQLVRQTIDRMESGSVRITLHPDPRLHHSGGAVHGGILGLVVDNAGYFAAATVSGGFWVVTTEFKVNLLEAAPDEPLVATGTVLRRGRHLVHTEMQVAAGSGAKIAVGLGTYAIVPRRFRGA